MLGQTTFNSLSSYLNREIRSWNRWAYALFLVYLTFPYLRLFEEPGSGLDPSWQIALGLLRDKVGVWGQDFVFSYGPLGSYIYRLPIGVQSWQQFLYDAFFFANLIYFHATCFPPKAKNYHVLIFLVFNLFSFEMMGESSTFLWMFLGMYHGVVALKSTKRWVQAISIWMSFILLGIIFFTKANYGMIVWAFLAGLLVLMTIQKKIKWWHLVGLICGFSGVLILWAFFLQTDLLAYFQTSLHIIANYNAGMSVFPEGFKFMTAVTYLLFVLQILWTIYWLVEKDDQTLSDFFLVILGLGISFLLLKYSFLRADSGHLTAYVKLITYVGILLIARVTSIYIRRFYYVLLPFVFVLYVSLYVPIVGFTPLGIMHGIKYRPFIIAHYLWGQDAKVLNHKIPKLPLSFLNRIKNQSVDIIPYELSYAYTYRLNYRPRPTLQSYLAGDRYLDSLNYQFYCSDRAPKYVIYGLEKSSLKYPWSEESFTQKALFENYEIVDSNDSLLLFERKFKRHKLRWVYTRHDQKELGDEIEFGVLQKGYLRESQFDVVFSPLGNLSNLIFQPPQLIADFRSGRKHEVVRVTLNLLKKGFWSNHLILDLKDAKKFYEHSADSTQVLTSIKFSENHFFSGGYKPEIRVTHRFYRIE